MVVAGGGGGRCLFYRIGRGEGEARCCCCCPPPPAAPPPRNGNERNAPSSSTTREGTPFSLFPSRTLLAIPSLLPLPESLSPLWNGVVCGWRRRRVSQQRPSVAIRSSRGERGMAYFRERERGKKARSLRPSVRTPLPPLTYFS